MSTDTGNLLKLGTDDLVMLDPDDLPAGGGGGLDATGVPAGRVPTADGADGWQWAAQAGGGGGPAQIATTTLSGVDGEGTVDLGAVGQVLDVTVDGPCRVRAYRSSAERTADAARDFSTPYVAENGLLYDYLFTEAGTDQGRPWGYAGDVFVRVDGGPVDIDVRYVTTGVE